MRHAQSMSFFQQLRVVLQSYLTRPGIRWAALALVAGLAGVGAASAVGRFLGNSTAAGNAWTGLLAALSSLMAGCGIIGLGVMFFIHARHQLMGPAARMIPHTRQADLVVAGGVLPLLVAIFTTCLLWDRREASWLGVFSISLLCVILVGYAVCRPWLIPILILVVVLPFRYLSFSKHLDEVIRNDGRLDIWCPPVNALQRASYNALTQKDPRRITDYFIAIQPIFVAAYEQYYRYLSMLRVAVLLADFLALIGLGRLSKPTHIPWVSLAEPWRRIAPRPRTTSRVVANQRHRYVGSRFSQSLHRRFAVHDRRAAGVAALSMGLMSVWFYLQFDNRAAAPLLTAMLAFLPGALVAIGWRERWPNFDFESLYPVSRREFITDMAAGLALDAAEFWVAATVATLLACVCMRIPALSDGRFWAALLVGAMMQFLWLGGIFLVGQKRQTASYIAGLTPVALAVFLPLQAMWRWDHAVSAGSVVLFAIVEMCIGLAMFGVTWALLQRSPPAQSARA